MSFGKLKGPRLGAVVPRVRVDDRAAGINIYATERWKRLSKTIRAAVRACMACGRKGCRLYVDHVEEIADGGEPYALSNLCVLCASCHARKTHAVRLLRLGLAVQDGGVVLKK